MNIPMQHPQRDLTTHVESTDSTSAEAIKSFALLLRRQWRLIAATCFLGIALAVVLLSLLPKKYTATASVFVDFLHPASLTTQMTPPTLGLVDPAAVQSQIDILASERVAMRAIKRLDLFKTPDLILHPLPIISSLNSAAQRMGLIDPPSDYAIRRAVVNAVMKATTVERAGKSQGGQQTFVIELSFDAQDPQLAARVANALVETYLTDGLEARFDTAKRANDWFTERLEAMRKSVTSAEATAEKYKAENNITVVNGKGATSLVEEQNLAQIEESLTATRGALADARSRLDALDQIIASGNPQAGVSDALASPSIQRLRGQYADFIQRAADLRYRGTPPGHYVLTQLTSAIAETQHLIMDEFARLRSSTQNEVDSTQRKIAQLEEQSSNAAESLKQTRAKALHATELDREASAVRTLYEVFMNQFQVTTQAQSFPVSEARMITVAEPPVKQSRRSVLIMAVGGVLGVLAGGSVAWLRETAGRIKTGQELEELIGAPFLGTLPTINVWSIQRRGRDRIDRVKRLLTYAISHPMSGYAETIRNCKAALLHRNGTPPNAILGVVSAVQAEGKSTFAANLAFHLASSGYRTLLVDADTRNPELSTAFNKEGADGLVQILSRTANVHDVLHVEPESRLFSFLASGVQEAIAHADELLMSQAFEQFVASLREEFRYVIFDLPPMGPVVDAGIVSRQVDGFYYIATWNKTSNGAIRKALQKSYMAKSKIIGGIINCVPNSESDWPNSYYRS